MKEYNLYALKIIDDPRLRYVGITTRPIKRRLSGHLHAATQEKNTYRVVQWIRKYGPQNIEIVLLGTFNSHEDLKQAEVDKIAELRAQGPDLLNHTDGGDGVLGLPAWNKGKKMSEEQKELLRQINLGKVLSVDHKRKIREGTQRHFEENGQKSVHDYWIDKYGPEKASVMKSEWFELRSASLSGSGNPMYGRRGADAPTFGRTGEKHPMFGKHHSAEAKASMSAALKGKPLPLETRVRMSQAQHKRSHSDKSLVKPTCVWCNGSSLEDEIIRRSSLEDAKILG